MRNGHPPWFLLRHSVGGIGTIGLALVILAVLTIRYWPMLAESIETWVRSLKRP